MNFSDDGIWLLGLVVCFSLRVREVPGSIPGAALAGHFVFQRRPNEKEGVSFFLAIKELTLSDHLELLSLRANEKRGCLFFLQLRADAKRSSRAVVVVDGLPCVETQSTCGLVAMTSASHAEGRQLDPGQVYFFSGLEGAPSGGK